MSDTWHAFMDQNKKEGQRQFQQLKEDMAREKAKQAEKQAQEAAARKSLQALLQNDAPSKLGKPSPTSSNKNHFSDESQEAIVISSDDEEHPQTHY